jgi:hypothetical protein
LYNNDGSVKKEYMDVRANPPPSFREFAKRIGVAAHTLVRWESVHPEFEEAMREARAILEDFITQNGLLGHYNANFAQFIAINRLKMKNKSEVDHTTDGKPIASNPLGTAASLSDEELDQKISSIVGRLSNARSMGAENQDTQQAQDQVNGKPKRKARTATGAAGGGKTRVRKKL